MSRRTQQTGEITALLKAFSDGDSGALDRLLPIVHAELKRQAHRYLRSERKNHTLQTTALVNEAFLRLIGQNNVDWKNRAHFFGISATMMRRILVNYAKGRNRLKRGGPVENITLDEALYSSTSKSEVDLIALDEALIELEQLDGQQAKIVDLRYFGGLTITQTAEALSISPATVKRDWKMAKSFLKASLIDRAEEQ